MSRGKPLWTKRGQKTGDRFGGQFCFNGKMIVAPIPLTEDWHRPQSVAFICVGFLVILQGRYEKESSVVKEALTIGRSLAKATHGWAVQKSVVWRFVGMMVHQKQEGESA